MVATKTGAAKSTWIAHLREARAAYHAQKRDAENEAPTAMDAKRVRGSNPRDSRGRFACFSAEVLGDSQPTPSTPAPG